MPVLSPHRSTSSSISTYRPTTTSLDRPFVRTTTTTATTYRDRYSHSVSTTTSTRSFSLRSASISEDGYTYDEGGGRSTLETSSAVSVADSIAELRTKYSASNYVPAVLRNRDNLKVTSTTANNANNTNNDCHLPAAAADVDNMRDDDDDDDDDDDNGNQVSVLAITRKFEQQQNDFASYIPSKNGVRKEHVTTTTTASREDGGMAESHRVGLNGLKNIGNTCFMNSVLQCLSNTRPLLEYVRHDGFVADINASLSSMRGALIKAFAAVVRELWADDGAERVVNTATLKTQIQRFAPRFIGYAQQDAQEFLRYLLEGLHEDINRVTCKPTPIHTDIDDTLSDAEKAAEAWQRYVRRENSKIVDLFVGQLKSTLRCTHCGHCSVTFDPFWDLSLPIPQRSGTARLSQCLDVFTREETLDGDEKPTCSKCRERRKCTKSFAIHKFPKILVIHLKRFSPTERYRGKLSVTVDFPLEALDMSDYASETSVQCRYNLYAVSNHSGTTYSGHYTAYCRHPYSGAWHEYNDSRVASISGRSVVSSEAYVLFYELDGAGSSRMAAHL